MPGSSMLHDYRPKNKI